MKKIPEDLYWFKFATFPVFFGQVTGAFEGIGTVKHISFYTYEYKFIKTV